MEQNLQRGFSDEEFEDRTSRCQSMMAQNNLDALWVCTEPEVRYFTGFHTPFWQSPTRPWFVVVPFTGKPIAVIPSIGASTMSSTWIEDIRTWPAPQPEDDGVSLLIDCLKEVSGPNGRIGLPMGPETHVRMPLNDLEKVRSEFREFFDATEIIRLLRMV